MRRQLARLVPKPGQVITAKWGRLFLETLERLVPPEPKTKPGRTDTDHPFRVECDRWDSDLATPKNRQWRVDVSTGFANDLPASILYRRTGDVRGWKLPAADWQTPGLPPSKTVLDLVDRSLIEMGGDDPPFMVVTVPAVGTKKEGLDNQFRPWTSARPTYFQQSQYKDKELWWAAVSLGISPTQAFPDSIQGPIRAEVAAKLPERFRLRAGRLPINSFGGVAGGTVEIARLWLVRDPLAKDVLAADTIEVQQKVYTHLQALIVTPGLSVTDGSILGDLAQDLINAALAAAAGQEIWSG